MSDRESLARTWFERVWNRGESHAIDELFAADGLAHGLGDAGRPLHGPPEFHLFHDRMRSAFPDCHVTVQEIITDGDRLAARFLLTGTHTGPGLGVEPTGRRVAVTGMCFIHYRGNQIHEAWTEFDAAGLMAQVRGEGVAAKA